MIDVAALARLADLIIICGASRASPRRAWNCRSGRI